MSAQVTAELWQAIESFYRREVLLLQDRRYRDWLSLMDGAIRYRVPVSTSTLEGLVTRDDELGYYDEDAALLEARVQKLESRQSWVEQPPSRLRYFVQVLDVTAGEAGVTVRSNLLLYQYRWNMEQHFTGDRLDLLVGQPDWRIRSRTVRLDRPSAGRQGLSVFF